MEKIQCSVPILTLNAAKNLAECLESVRDFSDVYLVDGNSTDGTHAIAARFGIPVYKQVETDEPNVRITDFSATRRRAYSFAKTDWLLDLDSDEYLTPELVAEIRGTLARNSKAGVAYRIANKLQFGDQLAEHAFFYPSYVLRLYNRKDGIDFPQGKMVHESVSIPSGIRIEDLQGHIWSRGPESYTESVQKDNRYLAMTRQKFLSFEKGPQLQDALHITNSLIKNFARIAYIPLVSLWIYMQYGYQHSLPPAQILRHTRYALMICKYRIEQFGRLVRLLITRGSGRVSYE